MRVHLESVLPCSVEQAWDAVQTTALLREVTLPLLTFPAVDPGALPVRWSALPSVRLRSFLYGLIPLGERVIEIESVDSDGRVIRTRERDSVVRSWKHRISVQPAARGFARYSDTVDINAGMFTVPIWAFAQCLYRHRQRRWRRVAKRLNDPASPADGS
jgi:hypothetical protein